MKSERIMKIFEQYVRKYDMNNSYIKSRYFHSLKVMEICRDLATGLGIFSPEEVAVVTCFQFLACLLVCHVLRCGQFVNFFFEIVMNLFFGDSA